MYKSFLKRLFDVTVSSLAIIFLSPILLIIGLLIMLDSEGPVFFFQERLGKNGVIFKMIKFRSMAVNQVKGSDNKLYEDDPNITRVGHFIRKTSLDELPQIINILSGEMSFIGPRPPVTYFPKRYEDYNDFEKQRFLVKPGISGLAQVRCREIHDWDVNIPIDVEYVNNYSFSYDAKIFVQSIFAFFRTNNVYRKK